jgi:WD40 repeat protein
VTLLERLQDVCRFVITFHTPISISTPHTYLSTGPFLPSQSTLSSIFSKHFTKGMKMRTGNLLSWPEPQEWSGHTSYIQCMTYSPSGNHVATGSSDNTIRIWDAETGAVVGEPLVGHTDTVESVVCSPDGQHIISGSNDKTIRVWDAETGTAVGQTLVGHSAPVNSVACSPDGRHIISGSGDITVRMLNLETGTAVKRPPEGYTESTQAVSYSPDAQHTASGSSDNTTQVWSPFPHVPIQQSFQICVHCQIQKVGSRTHRVPYCTGYFQTVV